MKVCGCSFPRNGNRSLGQALKTLGYVASRLPRKSTHTEPLSTKYLESCLHLMQINHALYEWPWAFFFPLVDQHFEGVKFILTLRDSELWWESASGFFASKSSRDNTWFRMIFGDGPPDRDRYISTYEFHNEYVRQYFRHRPDDLLVIDISERFSWQPLCGFLGKEVPDRPFPHLNKTEREYA